MARVGLVFGGRSVEHRVSMISAAAVAGALRRAGHQVVPLGIAPDGCWLPAQDSIAALESGAASLAPVGEPIPSSLHHLLAAQVEVLFPIVHGTWGEDGSLQGLFEILDLPYVGAGVAASALAMDKLLCKQLLDAAGLPIVDFEAVSRYQFESSRSAVLERLQRLKPPLFVKPSVGGSSVGITRVASAAELEAAVGTALAFDDTALVERGVEGRELECSVLGYRRIEASPVGEIVPGNAFYDYADKYLQDTAGLHAPADIPAALSDRLQQLAVAAFSAIGGWGMARVDFLLERPDRPFVNEINTLPGFTQISMYPRLWKVAGVELPQLVDRLVDIAIERYRERKRLDRGIKDWLAQLEGPTPG